MMNDLRSNVSYRDQNLKYGHQRHNRKHWRQRHAVLKWYLLLRKIFSCQCPLQSQIECVLPICMKYSLKQIQNNHEHAYFVELPFLPEAHQ